MKRKDAVARKVAVAQEVAGRITRLEQMKDLSRQRALLAELRRGAGKRPGELPQLWGMFLWNLPEEMMGWGAEPSREEWAVYTSLTLYALHQQGAEPGKNSVNAGGQGLGRAAAKLVADDADARKRIQRRLNRIALASDLPDMLPHLRALVILLKGSGIGLDYPQLAKDLYEYQFYDGMSDVRLRWGRDFYRIEKSEEEPEND